MPCRNTSPRGTLETVSWQGTTLLEGDVAEEVARLKEQPGRELR